jgi:hypothetical protein
MADGGTGAALLGANRKVQVIGAWQRAHQREACCLSVSPQRTSGGRPTHCPVVFGGVALCLCLCLCLCCCCCFSSSSPVAYAPEKQREKERGAEVVVLLACCCCCCCCCWDPCAARGPSNFARQLNSQRAPVLSSKTHPHELCPLPLLIPPRSRGTTILFSTIASWV